MRGGPEYHRIRLADILLVSVIILSNIPFLRQGSENASVVIITPEKEIIKTLESDWKISIDGPYGLFTIVNETGTVRIIETQCPQKICMGARINSKGGIIICRPNHIYIFFEGGPDAITR
jgi:hypothetical protein